MTWRSLLLNAVVLVLSVEPAAAAPMRVSVSTTLIESAAKQIGGSRVSVTTLITPGTCPGHSDLTPKEIVSVSQSALLLIHGYEKPVTKILTSLGQKRPNVVTISVAGNWLIPDNYVRASRLVAKALGQADPNGIYYYKTRLKALEAECRALAVDARARAKRIEAFRTKVICADQQCEFVEWVGFDVAMTYGRSEELTPRVLGGLARTGRAAGVRLVVDNLQSGPTTGRQLARDIGALHVTLSGFPGGFEGTSTWQNLFRDNVDRLLRGFERPRK